MLERWKNEMLWMVLLVAMPWGCCAQGFGDPNRHVIFVHGFNISEQEARTWGATMFKRLFQSGNKATYHVFNWKGDEGWPDPGLFYHQNVANAFAAAPQLAAYVGAMSGSKVVIAHSLGNMVVASAIADYGMAVDKFIMLNAAVPVEAYAVASHNHGLASNPMLHTDWSGYQNKAWASCWNEHFSQSGVNDDRAKLRWKGRFASIPPSVMYNFYSPGDEVLMINMDYSVLYPTTGGEFRLYAWQKQERFKGRSMVYGTSWSGWGFGHPTCTEQVWDASAQAWVYLTHEYYPDTVAANAASVSQIMDFPVFTRYPDEMFTNAIPLQVQNEILAKGIPALSPPAGNSPIPGLDADHNINLDVMDVYKMNGWRLHTRYGSAWLHSDWMNMSYQFVYPLFDKIVEIGGLR